ncbi:MAG: hypothetical protein KBE21_06955 [Acetoanaerobium sp.]|jgi:hypothetical protein|uniref:hypothetical protein n=1 Tax=Acetoanaerobium noterae TaxID=745369 RepID=UPI001B7BE743|nr:hypothetical protein [Acetoanaerobium sp.]MBP9499351.1 hypothetical protein [Acetoanaerobium sp.]MBP9563138.1 hypothetical protein [Acetoanaerobium sp.]
MKNKLLIFLLLGVFCINIKLIADNYRLKNDYKLAYLSAENIQSEMIDNVEANNNNLENINRLMVLVDNLEIKELSSIDINSNYLILTLEVADIESLKVIETALSEEIKLGTPEMEIYFDDNGITGLLKYKGDRL